MLDIIILLLLLFGAIRGYFTGFILQSFTLIALFGGIWIGIKYNSYFSALLKNIIELNDSVLPYFSFAVLFVIVIVLVHLLGMLITKFMDKSALGFLNRVAGILFGIVKLAFIISVCFWLIDKFDPKGDWITVKHKEESKLYTYVSKIAPAVFPLVDFEKIKKGMLQGD